MALSLEREKSSRHIGLWIFLAIVVAAVIAVGWYGYSWYKNGQPPTVPFIQVKAASSADTSTVSASDVSLYTVPDAQPRYLNLPGSSTNLRVYPVGLDATNMIKLPTNIHDVSWYNKSSLPGSGGVVILTGYNQENDQSGALSKLSSYKKGDTFTIQTGNGETYTYVVYDNQTINLTNYNTTGTKELSQSAVSGVEGLNIVVNAGSWSSHYSTYDHRTIVRSTLTNS